VPAAAPSSIARYGLCGRSGCDRAHPACYHAATSRDSP
jgi:hypothetical protein